MGLSKQAWNLSWKGQGHFHFAKGASIWKSKNKSFWRGTKANAFVASVNAIILVNLLKFTDLLLSSDDNLLNWTCVSFVILSLIWNVALWEYNLVRSAETSCGRFWEELPTLYILNDPWRFLLLQITLNHLIKSITAKQTVGFLNKYKSVSQFVILISKVSPIPLS